MGSSRRRRREGPRPGQRRQGARRALAAVGVPGSAHDSHEIAVDEELACVHPDRVEGTDRDPDIRKEELANELAGRGRHQAGFRKAERDRGRGSDRDSRGGARVRIDAGRYVDGEYRRTGFIRRHDLLCLGSAWRASRAVAEETVQDQQRTAELARFGTAIVPDHHIRKGGHSDETGELRFERLTKALLGGSGHDCLRRGSPVLEMTERADGIGAVVTSPDQTEYPLARYAPTEHVTRRAGDLVRGVFHEEVDADREVMDGAAIDLGHLRRGDARDITHDGQTLQRHLRPTRMILWTAKLVGVIWNRSIAKGGALASRRLTSAARPGAVCERSSQLSVTSFVRPVSESTVVARPACSSSLRHPPAVWLRTCDGSRSVSISLMKRAR